MTTTIPIIEDIPAPPSLSRPKTFDAESDSFLGDFPRMFTEQNAAIAAMNQLGVDITALADVANQSAENALAIANYRGEWSSLSGAVSIPASVSHGGEFYILTASQATIQSVEPGVSSVWVSPWANHYTKSELDDLLAGRYTKAEVDDLLVGQVANFASSVPPNGWLKANGAAISRATYSRLFGVIGVTFGSGNGSTTFNLPDLRGYFTRGWDDSRGIDSGRVFGSSQADENKSHTHAGSADAGGSHSHTGTADAAGGHNHTLTVSSTEVYYGAHPFGASSNAAASNSSSIQSGGSHSHALSISNGGSHSHALSIGSSGGSEARPKNIALLACIKY